MAVCLSKSLWFYSGSTLDNETLGQILNLDEPPCFKSVAELFIIINEDGALLHM